MIKPSHILKGVVAATWLAVFPTHAGAQEADLRDEAQLLERLKEAEPGDADWIEAQLRAVWAQSGSAAMDLLLKRGQDALEVEDFDAAIGHLTALTDHAPEFAEGWVARATAYYLSDLFGPAVADLERALALNPHHYEAIIGLAIILEQVGYPKLAFDAYEQAASIHPHHEAVTNGLERLGPRVGGQDL